MNINPVLEVSATCDKPNSIQNLTWKELPTIEPQPELNLHGDVSGGFHSNSFELKEISVIANVAFSSTDSLENEAIRIIWNSMIDGNKIFFRYIPLGKVVNGDVFFGEVRVKSINLSGKNVNIFMEGTKTPCSDRLI